MGTVYLHIGIFKTGSSALQVFFARNAAKLKDQGLIYPQSASVSNARRGLITSGNGSSLALALKQGAPAENRGEQLAWFGETLVSAKSHGILLSSEIFCDLPVDAFQTLKSICHEHGMQLQVIAFVREQASYMESLYIQQVKRRHITSLPEPYIRDRYPKARHLKYHAFLSSLSDTVGAENLKVRDYGAEDVIAAMCEIMGLEPDNLERPPKKINISLPYFLVPMFLELNKMDPNKSFSDQVVRNQSQLQQHATAERRTLLSPDLQQEIRGYFADENKRLSQAFFGGAEIFNKPLPPYISLEDASKVMDLMDVTKLLGGLAIQHERRLIRIENALLALGDKAGFEPGWVRKITTD
ncbi:MULTISPECIES: hypothetical protein [Kordiimonas]|uniref:hypothetical protein n=1 Tax=Kordiimonas TaxID=288021 RepID=UPI002580E51D|nr:hypothetical protein [Kordiimonas sp. UBA4487]